MGRAWRHNEAAGGQVELETRSCFSGYNQTIFKGPNDYYDARRSLYIEDVRDFFDSMRKAAAVAYGKGTEETGIIAGEVSMAPSSISGSLQGYTRVWQILGIYRLSAEDGRKEPIL